MCYHPNIMIQDRDLFNPNTGKNWQKVAFYNSRAKDFKGYEYWDDFNNDPERNCNGKYKAVRIKCNNQCIQCCENKAKEWATKIMLETLNHRESYMITLTYNDKWLPITNEMWCENLKCYFYDDGTWNSYLEYDHAKTFIEKVREWQENKYGIHGIKFFGCGEYGGENGRSHFHIIMMGMHLDPKEVKVKEITTDGNVLYTCEELEKCWIPPGARRGQHEPMGYVTIAECNWQTARYVAGYVQKKNLHNKHDEYEYFSNKEAYYARRGQTPEKCFMSNHPGIGKKYYDQEKTKIFQDGYIMIRGAKNELVKARIPQSYEKLLEAENDIVYERYKEQKQEAAMKEQARKMAQTSLTIQQQLEVEERIKKDKMLVFNLRNKVG